MSKKLYEFTLEEHNGEQEYSNSCLVWANDETDALEQAREYARLWYNHDDDEDDEPTHPKDRDGNPDPDEFEFIGGEISVTLYPPTEVDLNDWKQRQYEHSIINGEAEPKVNEGEDGICPLCGHDLTEPDSSYESNTTDDGRIMEYKCGGCGFEGQEIWKEYFVEHLNKDGEQITVKRIS